MFKNRRMLQHIDVFQSSRLLCNNIDEYTEYTLKEKKQYKFYKLYSLGK